MIEAHLAKLRARSSVSADEEQAIRDSLGPVREVPPHTIVVRAGELLSESTLLIDGILGRYRDLRNGERQFTELHVAGDFADLHSFTLKRLDHDVIALTRCRLAPVAHDRLKDITERFPHLTRIYWFSTNLDAAIHREWAVSLGRRTALARIAHLLCELQARLAIVGLADESGFALDLSQAELAECVGLTPIHVNRTLRALRERELVIFRNQRVTFLDLAGLKKVAEFNPAYLYLGQQPD